MGYNFTTFDSGTVTIFTNSRDGVTGMHKYFDVGTLIIILITFILFIVALFVKGFTQDLLLEAGVLLISIKLIMLAYKNRVISNEITKDLQEIKKMLSNKT